MYETVLALRRACFGTLLGVSTGEWIEGSGDRVLSCNESWQERPDYASVNLSEPGVPAVMEPSSRSIKRNRRLSAAPGLQPAFAQRPNQEALGASDVEKRTGLGSDNRLRP